jgi:hypothetical protein
MDSSSGGGGIFAAGVAVVVIIIVGVVGLVGWLGGYVKTDGGHVAVVRNGGPLDNNKVRTVVPAASSRTWGGFWSKVHEYPAQQRFYTISSNASASDSCNVDVVNVPSQDGVDLGIEGTIYFTLNTDPKLLADFDNKFGTRRFTYHCEDKTTTTYPWDGDNGWSAFLANIARPVIDNDLREQIGSFRCAELVSSCALVQNTAGLKAEDIAKLGSANGANIAAVQDSINKSLTQDFTQTLGGNFLTNVTFRLSRATLPPNVQTAVNDAQAAFAGITQAQAKVAQAQAEAAANRQKELGYRQCPICGQIDMLDHLPDGITTFAPGAGFGITGK